MFCHARDLQGIKALVTGSKVSFVFQEDEKGGKAKEVVVEEAVEEPEQIREVSRFPVYALPWKSKLTSTDWYCQGTISPALPFLPSSPKPRAR